MKLDNKRTILIGFAFLAISAFWQVYDNIIPLILKYTFHIGDTLSGGIMALDNIRFSARGQIKSIRSAASGRRLSLSVRFWQSSSCCCCRQPRTRGI